MEYPIHGYAPQIAYNSINGGKNMQRTVRQQLWLWKCEHLNCLKPFVGFEEYDSIKRWESCGPHLKKVCENFSLKFQMSNEYLKEEI